MRPLLARFSEPVWSGHLASWADFITTTPELEFSVHTPPGRTLEKGDWLPIGKIAFAALILPRCDIRPRIERLFSPEGLLRRHYLAARRINLAGDPQVTGLLCRETRCNLAPSRAQRFGVRSSTLLLETPNVSAISR